MKREKLSLNNDRRHFSISLHTYWDYCRRCNNLVRVIEGASWYVTMEVSNRERCKLPLRECFEEK